MSASSRIAVAGLLLGLTLMALPAHAQETRLAAEFRREKEHLQESCGLSFKQVTGCVTGLVTGSPLHVALGSLAPQNGFALGAAFGTSHAPNETWRLSWSADAVHTLGNSWRAGAFMKLIHTPSPVITLAAPSSTTGPTDDLAVRPHTIISLYTQATSLERVSYFGLGPSSARSDKAVYGLRHIVAGGSVIAPVNGWQPARRLNLSVVAELNARFFTVRDGTSDDVPPVSTRFSRATAPGLDDQPAFFQMGEGVRLMPRIGRYFGLNYLLGTQQFVAADEHSSFQRWRLDLGHDITFYGTSRPADVRDTNTPNDCATSPGADRCAPVSRNRRGSLNLRVLYLTSSTASGQQVPFYLQPTLGGSDINGRPSLPSYEDYRFRAPNLLLLQQTVEHSIWGPVGAWLQADEGQVALARGDLWLGSLKRTIAAGLTIRAGGFPMLVVSYATGGGEGHHVAFTMSTSLLGGSSRPPLD
ncbi:MAG: hypothetical protein ABI051_06780 [Vicinamibacterales bacterium]